MIHRFHIIYTIGIFHVLFTFTSNNNSHNAHLKRLEEIYFLKINNLIHIIYDVILIRYTSRTLYIYI